MSSIKHEFVSTVPDTANPNEVQGSDWNAPHVFDPPVKGLLYDAVGSGNIVGLQTVGLLQDRVGDGTITPVRVKGLLNDALGDGNITGVSVSGVISDPDGDGTFTGIKVTGLWNDDGNGNISGVRHRGLLMDKAGNGIYSGVDVAGVPVNPVGDNNYVGISASAEGQVLRRKYGTVLPSYEFSMPTRVISVDFDFAPITPTTPTALIMGSNTVTFPYLPPGINEATSASAINKHFLILLDTGGPNDYCTIVGVNIALKQITFICNNAAHTAGTWRLISSTAGIQEAIHSIHNTGKSVQVIIPSGMHVIQGSIYPVNSTADFVTITGEGAILVRGLGNSMNPFFIYDSSGLNKRFDCARIKFLNGQYQDLSYIATTAPVFNLLAPNCTLVDIDIISGYGAVVLSGTCSDIYMERVSFVQDATYTALIQSAYGVFINGSVSNVHINNCRFVGTTFASANYLNAGIIIRGGNGIWITGTKISATNGISLEAGNSQIIANIYVDSCSLEQIKTIGINVTGANNPVSYLNLKFTNNRISSNSTTVSGTVGIQINGDADYVSIIGNIIFGWGHHGILIFSGLNFEGNSRRSVLISSNEIYANNQGAFSDGAGIRGSGTVTSLVIIGNIITNRSATVGHQKYGINIDGISACAIVGNKLYNNETAAFLLPTVASLNVISANLGISDSVVGVASAATITIGPQDVIGISGTTPISFIIGGWTGRKVTFQFSDAAPGGFAAASGTNSVATTYTVTSGKTITLVFNGAQWF